MRKRDDEPGGDPWHRNPAVIFTAGGVGLALVVALVFTVVQFSDDWSRPETTVYTTPAPSTTDGAPSTLPPTAPIIATYSGTSSTFTTSVPLSTTEIGLPGPGDPSTSGTETTSGSDTTSPSPGRSWTTERRPSDDDDDGVITTTRKRPRLNETRTLSP